MSPDALTDRGAVRRALDEMELRPSRRLGQNFLVNPAVVDAIQEAVCERRPKRLIEIGPGLGAVTEQLAKLGVPLTAIEIDPRLAERLALRLAGFPHVTVRTQDFLIYDLIEEIGEPPALVVGNIPYAITAPILRRLILHRGVLASAILLTQREVAEKVAASPGPDGTALGVLVQAYAHVESVRRVSAGSFYPKPEVDSVLWTLTFRDTPRFTADEEVFFIVCRAIYAARRKMLRRALRAILPTEAVGAALHAAGLDGSRRGETLSFPDLDKLAAAVEDLRR